MVDDAKLKIGIFASTLSFHDKRGANRLFRAMFDALRARQDVDIYILDKRLSYINWPNDTLFSFFRPGDNQDNQRQPTSVLERLSVALDHTKIRREFVETQYRRHVPTPIRLALTPVTRFGGRVFDRCLRHGREFHDALKGKLVRRGLDHLGLKDITRQLFAPDTTRFSNAEIKVQTLNISQLDVILNFWWLHYAHQNPGRELCLPQKTLMYGWFLDAIPLRIPPWQPGLMDAEVFRCRVQSVFETSDRVVAISRSASDDARSYFGVAAKDLAVVPCGIFEEDFAKSSERDRAGPKPVICGVDLTIPTIVMLGVQEPSKNIVNILRSMCLVAEKINTDFQCVFIGAHIGFSPEREFSTLLKALPARVKVHFVGAITETQKRDLLVNCSLLLYPSLWEGFGIPPLEAMAAGVPVVVSDLASLPEVCGAHAIYCDPYEPQDIAAKTLSVLAWDEGTRRVWTDAAMNYAREWLWSAKAIPVLIEDIQAQLARRKSG